MADGSDDEWERLCKRLYARVRRFFANKVPEEDVDDLTQTVFLRLRTALERFEGRANESTFTLGIARLVLLEYIRGRKRNATLDFASFSAADLDPRPSTLLVAKAEDRRLLEALRRLTLDHQIVLELYYWENLSTVEIGEVLDENHNTIRGRLDRARDKLLRALSDLGGDGGPLPPTTTDLDRWARGIREKLGDDDEDDEDENKDD